jgi:hypothetical protein
MSLRNHVEAGQNSLPSDGIWRLRVLHERFGSVTNYGAEGVQRKRCCSLDIREQRLRFVV